MVHQHDVLIIGSGLAGLRAAFEVSKKANTAVITKVFPTRSHSGAAQGGVGASLGNVDSEDNWEFHMFDTVKGSDYLGDQDAIEILVRSAPEDICELEHLGVPFSRTKEGKIAQRPFGGHTLRFGEKAVNRACYSSDYTGHVILHTLYEQSLKNHVRFYNEFQATFLIMEDNVCKGVAAWDIINGGLHIFHAKAVLFASGGYGRAFKITSNAHANTGDGLSLVLRAGLPVQDMEFVQFHPTGLYKQGILVTEGARGEGGQLLNKDGKRFMENYAKTLMELAPRDLVSRSIQTEINEGRGIDGKDFVHLDISFLGAEKLDQLLPQVRELTINFVALDPAKEPIPIQPTAHYSMGGIPATVDGDVICDGKATPVTGLFAAGECACISVHGANRLGCNSLLDAVSNGKRAGKRIASVIDGLALSDFDPGVMKKAQEEIDSLLNSEGPEKVGAIREKLQASMQDNCGIFRSEEGLQKQLQIIQGLQEKFKHIKIDDKSMVFNTDLIEAMELEHMLDFTEVMVLGALERKECRGAHWRTDYPKRDDVNWLKHTLAWKTPDGIKFDYRPVVITKFQPKERKY